MSTVVRVYLDRGAFYVCLSLYKCSLAEAFYVCLKLHLAEAFYVCLELYTYSLTEVFYSVSKVV